MQKLFVYTQNQHKLSEIQTIFQDAGLSILPYTQAGYAPIDIAETGTTFTQNAMLKVQPFTIQPNTYLIGDDSGICVQALGGRPGIYSARYGGEGLSSTAQCQMLLEELKAHNDRRAYFKSVIAIKTPSQEILTVEGRVDGTISHQIRGEKGFGYDPIFIPDGYQKTFAEMDPKTKNTLSHRYKALIKTKQAILAFH